MSYICGNCGKAAETPRFDHLPGCMGRTLSGGSAVREVHGGTGTGAGCCPKGHALHWSEDHSRRWCFPCNTTYSVEVRA